MQVSSDKGKVQDAAKEEKEKGKEKVEYATAFDKLLMIVGSLAAVANGAIQPAFSILIGRINDVFTPDKFAQPDYKLEDAVTPLNIGVAAFALSYMETGFWMLCGERQIRRVRENYLRAVLRQEIGWFDITRPSEISTRIASDTAVMQGAVGEKYSFNLTNVDMSTFVFGIAVGFIQGWQLTLVILAVVPLLAVLGAFLAVTVTNSTKEGLETYAGAGGIAEECISNMRTVTTFNAYKRESERYTAKLQDALKVGLKKGVITGLGVGLLMFVMFGSYALAFWYGSKLIADGTKNSTTGQPWTGGDVVTTFFSVVIGAFAIGQASPHLQAFASGRAAAYKIFSVIDRVSQIDPLDPSGEKPNGILGDVEFCDVNFAYPSRAEVPVLRGFSLRIPHGKTVALVGESGCGKSTAISLLEKFYLAEEGAVLVDGRDVKTLNTKWLRKNLGLVSQEPQLFATSIAENIRFGKENATIEEIIEAAKMANAHSFISELPQGYDTLVGEKGVQMSGGQKQRIAIARAVIKNPSILLLDEATSALDTENERLVQEALDRMMVGRTTIVIAHRLATVRNADKIVVIREGRVVEEGVHEGLMAMNGLYFNLVHRQTKNMEDDNKTMDVPEDIAWSPKLEGYISDPEPLDTSSGGDAEMGPTSTQQDTKYKVSFARLARESRPELLPFLFGLVGAGINGSTFPIFALVYGEIVATFNKPDHHDVKTGANFLAEMFLVLAIGCGLGNFFQIVCFTIIGEKLTFRLRDNCFKSILRQNIGWFDDEKNATGILATKLATDATLVQKVTIERVASIFQNIATVVVGMVIAFASGWKLSLVVVACMPFFVISSIFETRFMTGFSADAKEAYESAGAISTEAVGGIRTVASFTNETKLLAMYSARLEAPMRLAVRKAHISGAGFGASQFCVNAVNCLAMWYGARLVDQHEWKLPQSTIDSECSKSLVPLDLCTNQVLALYGFQQMTKVFMSIFMVGMGLGQSAQYAPDAAKASTAASSIYELIDRHSPIDPERGGGTRASKVEGNIEFREVHFAYPTRPTIPVFQGLNFSVPAGKTLALVGDSGGGKSTVIAMIERFYDPSLGSICLDGVDVKTLNLKFLRSQISLVSQEPSLFSTTIAKNIAYGKEDASIEEIQEAAKMANCHDFIASLPDGYHTLLGDKHTQLSGGQKQRVAIARAILRDPKVMLLDEATSALDAESEAFVQEALERVMRGRTTIVIAHRLSTIINADLIAVMKGGTIVELGRHNDLLALGGVYTNLVKRQL